MATSFWCAALPWVAKLIDRMFVREPAQTYQLAGALAPVQLQL